MRSAPRPRRRFLPRLVAVLLGLGSALVAAELGLRHLIFGTSERARALGKSLRHPSLYGLGLHHDDYWKLQALLDERARMEMNGPDALLGWTGSIEPGTYAHPDEAQLGERRPILLFGDSNAECVIGAEHCFQGLLERSDLGRTHALLNYGVGGYGLDQIYLMLRAALARHAHRDPIVVVSLMVDDDLERSLLSFRGWPKPRLRVESGKLVGPAPVLADTRRFLEQNPPSIRSYVARLVLATLRGPARRSERTPAELAELATLNRALLDAIQAELDARALEHLYFLFYFEEALRRRPPALWSEDIALEFLRASGAPYVSLAEVYAALCTPPWDCLKVYAPEDDPTLAGHLNDGGNRLAFAALRQGLEGALDLGALRRGHEQGEFRPTGARYGVEDLLGVPTRVYTQALYPSLRVERPGGRDDRLLVGVRAGQGAATRLVLELGGSRRRLQAEMLAVPNGRAPCPEASMRLRWRIGAGEWSSIEATPGAGSTALEIDLVAAPRLELVIECTGPDPECLWLALRNLRLD